MPPSREVHGTFTISSGHLCFGSLQNIWHGAGTPLQGFPTNLRPEGSGTVFVHHHKYNVPATKGTWKAFQLVHHESREVRGWFLAHSAVQPGEEIAKILRVSGSPYEFDSGSWMNNDHTSAEGVLVVNRYDWGRYNQRSLDAYPFAIAEEGSDKWSAVEVSVGLVDYAKAKAQVETWTTLPPGDRQPSKHGLWMRIPGGEYMYGRFGFDDERNAARSFLFFSLHTDFTETTFAGLQTTLLNKETPQEWFERNIRKGTDFSGLEGLRNRQGLPAPPPESEWLGPYDPSRYIFTANDVEALRIGSDGPEVPLILEWKEARNANLPPHMVEFLRRKHDRLPFTEEWREHLVDLMNELVLSYLEQLIVDLSFPDGTELSAMGHELFPKRVAPDPANVSEWAGDDFYDYHIFVSEGHIPSYPGINFEVVQSRIKDFLVSRSRSGASAVTFDDRLVAAITRIVVVAIENALEASSNAAMDNGHTGIVPSDLRLAVHVGGDTFRRLKYSRVFWEGRP